MMGFEVLSYYGDKKKRLNQMFFLNCKYFNDPNKLSFDRKAASIDVEI